MLPLDLDRLQANIQAASTEDLLDRVTAYRSGMEPEAIDLIERELRKRGITAADQAAYQAAHAQGEFDRDGLRRQCAYCRRPAVCRRWRWFRLFRRLPLFPLLTPLCELHAAPER
jgi:hypothetical protein